MKGLDTYNQIGQILSESLKSDGYDFVARYFFTSSSFKQPFNSKEAATLAANGLKIVSVYENGSPTSRGYFTPSKGQFDAMAALHQAKAVGQPTGTPIFFTVDYDADPRDVALYFKELAPIIMNGGYKVGVYGSGAVCSSLDKANLVAFTWLAQSKGWSGYHGWVDLAEIVQGPVAKIHGLDVDTDSISEDKAGWGICWTPAH